MMGSIEKNIENILSTIGIDAYYLYRPSEMLENAVFSYTQKYMAYADNKPKVCEYDILINNYVKLERNISEIRDEIIKVMVEKGFKIQPIPTPQKEKDFINIALRFKGIKFI